MTKSVQINAGYFIYRIMGTTSFVRRLEWRKMLAWLDPQPGEKVLDIACGVGELSLAIARRGPAVYGIDVSQAAIDYARGLSRRAGIPCRFEIAGAERLPYPDGFFDKIVCSSSMEHFSDDSRALREMTRVLKPGGRAVLTVDSFNRAISDKLRARHRRAAFVVRYYSRATLEASLRGAGQEVCRGEYLLNSFLTDFFFKLGIRYRLPAVLSLAISFFGYPAFLLSEKVFGRNGTGYTLLVESRKAA
jgi:ubiquinone/menaquinone biosynthesis C-methylase UbiE